MRHAQSMTTHYEDHGTADEYFLQRIFFVFTIHALVIKNKLADN